MTTGQKIGLALAVLGVGTVGVGVAVAVRRRKSGGELGRGRVPMIGTTRRGEKALRHYRKRNLPIHERVGLVQDQVFASVQDPEMVHLARAITGHGTRTVRVGSHTLKVRGAGCAARDGLCEAKAVDAWMRDPSNVRYTGDIAPIKLGRHGPVEAVDLFPSATRVIEMGGDDCDGHSIVAATLLSLNGITARHRVTSPQFSGDGWQHIYTVAGLPKEHPTEWMALDSTLPGGKFGQEYPAARKIDFTSGYVEGYRA